MQGKGRQGYPYPYPSAHSLADSLAVQAALELLDDNRSFRALVCDFQMLCRATAPPPREAMQTTYFIIWTSPARYARRGGIPACPPYVSWHLHTLACSIGM